MTDLFDIPQQAAPVAHAVVPAVKHVAHHAAAHLPTIKSGVSMFTTVIASIVSAVVAGVAGFYSSKLNVFSKAQTAQSTITTDVSNAKAEVNKVSSEVANVAHALHI